MGFSALKSPQALGVEMAVITNLSDLPELRSVLLLCSSPFHSSVVTVIAVNTTTLMIPVLAVAYLLLVYGVLLWWSRRSTGSSRT